jgi:alpha/beta superfamily hydrolase
MPTRSLPIASSNGPRLVGRLHQPARAGTAVSAPPAGAVVAAPHPIYGGRMDNPVVTELVGALVESGRTTLAFDWRGVGNSSGTASDSPEDACTDYAAALDALVAECGLADVLAGYSFGAVAALATALRRRFEGHLVLVAPPPALCAGMPLATLQASVHVLVGDRDQFAPVADLEAMLTPVAHAELDVLAGTDHFFGWSGLERIAPTVARRLPRAS